MDEGKGVWPPFQPPGGAREPAGSAWPGPPTQTLASSGPSPVPSSSALSAPPSASALPVSTPPGASLAPPGAASLAAPAAGGGGGGGGADLLQELLGKEPAEVAGWALEQVGGLQDAGVRLETLPIFRLAGAVPSARPHEKEALVRSVITGVGALPPPRRAEVVRLVMQNLGGAQQRSPDVDLGAGDPSAPPLIGSIMRLAQEARVHDMQPEELKSLAGVAQAAASKVVKPDELLSVVKELPAQEREQLTGALVEAHIVPEEQRATVQEAVRPGGHIDKLASALKVLDTACAFRWCIIFFLPVLELLSAWALGFCLCSAPLVGWVRADSLVTLAAAAAAAWISRTLSPVYERLRDDPLGSAQQWQTAALESGGSWKDRLNAAVPGVGLETYQTAGTGAVIFVGLQMLGGLWATVGIAELFAAAAMGCSGVVVLTSALFVTARVLVLAGTLLLLHSACDDAPEAPSLEELPRPPPPPSSTRRPRPPNSRSRAPKEASRAAPAAAPAAPSRPRAARTAAIPSRGRELHRQMANDHADLLERLSGLNSRGGAGQR